jgi:alpha-1,6-mannosyltransferase
VRGRLPALAAAAGIALMLAASMFVAAGAASRPSPQVPASRHGFPDWLRGPLRALHASGLTSTRFAVLLAAITVGYFMVIACAGAVPARWAIGAIVALHVVFALAPPLLSGDVFSYLQYARLGALHDLNPYAHGPGAIAGDLAYRFASEHRITSPYGPLFTLLSYALVPLGVAAGLWAFKAVTALASLGIVALVWRYAAGSGRDPVAPAVLVGLNPLVLVYAVGGAHNDVLMMLLAVAAAALLLRGSEPAGAAGLVASGAVKAASALLLPFAALGARRRARSVAVMAGTAAALAGVALLAFGSDALNLLDVLGTEQQRRAVGSVPRAASRLVGHPVLAEGVRLAAGVVLALAVLALLEWVRRGADWITAAGWAVLALLLTTAWLLPWYGAWLMPLAGLSSSRWLRLAALAFTAAMVASKVLPGLR